MSSLPWLSDTSPVFPPTRLALNDPNGLLAAGGNLAPETLINAYSKGIFPWFDQSQPILWWTPSPRMILFPQNVHISKSLKKLCRKKPFTITVDSDFPSVVKACASPRRDQDGTWITDEMMLAYSRLHTRGYAHSIEAWQNNDLVGGLYGVAIGKVFFGESMFSKVSGSSKVAFASLCQQLKQWNYELIDCQAHTPLLAQFGAIEAPRTQFESKLRENIVKRAVDNWKLNWTIGEFGFDGSE